MPKVAGGHAMYIDDKMLSVTNYSVQMYFQYVHCLILVPCFLLEWSRYHLQRSLLAKRLNMWTGNRRFLGYRRCHGVAYVEFCWEWRMFELHLTILALNQAHYPGWSVIQTGRDCLPLLGWHFVNTTDIIVLLQESFLLNTSIRTVHDFSHAYPETFLVTLCCLNMQYGKLHALSLPFGFTVLLKSTSPTLSCFCNLV